MCIFPKAPSMTPPPLPPEEPAKPTRAEPEAIKARDTARRRAAAGGRNSTILTSASGLAGTSAVTTGKKSLLGM